jgi:hypothetical protein
MDDASFRYRKYAPLELLDRLQEELERDQRIEVDPGSLVTCYAEQGGELRQVRNRRSRLS